MTYAQMPDDIPVAKESNNNLGPTALIEPTPFARYAPPQLSPELLKCYSLKKTVHFFAMFDTFFGFINTLFYTPFYLFFFIGGLFGISGTNKAKPVYIFYYLLTQYIQILGRFSLPFLVKYVLHKNINLTDFILTFLSGLIGIYVSRFTYILWKSIKSLTPNDREILRNIRQERVDIIYW